MAPPHAADSATQAPALLEGSVSVIVWVQKSAASSVFCAGVPACVVVSVKRLKPLTSIGKLPEPPRVILRTTRPTGGMNVFVNVQVTTSPSTRSTSTPSGRAGFGSGLRIVLWPFGPPAEVQLAAPVASVLVGISLKFHELPASRTNVAVPSTVPLDVSENVPSSGWPTVLFANENVPLEVHRLRRRSRRYSGDVLLDDDRAAALGRGHVVREAVHVLDLTGVGDELDVVTVEVVDRAAECAECVLRRVPDRRGGGPAHDPEVRRRGLELLVVGEVDRDRAGDRAA